LVPFGPEASVFSPAVKKRTIRIYKTIILPVVLYGCETWTLTLREKHRLRVFENRVLRRIFGPKRDEMMGEWRKLDNEELRELYSSASIIRIIKSRRMRSESFIRNITCWVLLNSMCYVMCSQISLCKKTFSTDITCKKVSRQYV
jgi:hypothetical protein